MEPIRQVDSDGKREDIAAVALSGIYPDWRFYGTPRYYFADFHLTKDHGNGRENYMGDLEIKWLRSSSNQVAVFPFNKLQQMMIAPPYTDGVDVYHRICFRFADGTSIIPARILTGQIPYFHVRQDTQERDLVVAFNAREYPQYWHNLVINE